MTETLKSGWEAHDGRSWRASVQGEPTRLVDGDSDYMRTHTGLWMVWSSRIGLWAAVADPVTLAALEARYQAWRQSHDA